MSDQRKQTLLEYVRRVELLNKPYPIQLVLEYQGRQLGGLTYDRGAWSWRERQEGEPDFEATELEPDVAAVLLAGATIDEVAVEELLRSLQ